MSTEIEIPQAGSPETQAIIDACFQLEAKGAEIQQLLEKLVPARNEQAEAALDDFLAQADKQGEGFVQAHDTSLQLVEDAFGNFQDALDAVLDAARDNSQEEAIKAAYGLTAASYGIRSAVVAYEESFLSYGDSRFPLINLLTNLGERVRGGQVAPEAWVNTCQRYAYFYASAIVEIENSEEKDKPGVPERKASLVKLVDSIKGLEKLGPSDSHSSYEDLIFSISGCLVDLSEAFETYHTHTFLSGESDSPRINLIIKVAKDTVDGTYDAGVLRLLVTDLTEELKARLEELNRLAENPQDSEILNDSIADMIDTLETMEDGLAALVRLSKGEEVPPEEIQESLDLLLESGDMLKDVNRTVEDYNKASSRVSCLTCGAEQAAGEACLSCGAPLPQPEATGVESSFQMIEGKEDVEAGETVMTTAMQELVDRTGDFDARRINAEAYSQILDQFSHRIDIADESLSQTEPPAMPEGLSLEDREICMEFITIADDGIALLEVGLEECREGIEHLRDFIETDNKESKDSGLQLYFEGIQKMWLVKRAQKRVEEFIAASVKELGGGSGPSGPAAPTSLSSRFT